MWCCYTVDKSFILPTCKKWSSILCHWRVCDFTACFNPFPTKKVLLKFSIESDSIEANADHFRKCAKVFCEYLLHWHFARPLETAWSSLTSWYFKCRNQRLWFFRVMSKMHPRLIFEDFSFLVSIRVIIPILWGCAED